MTRQYVFRCLAGGMLAGFGIMAAYAFRVVVAIHAGHRWGVVREFLDIGGKRRVIR